MQKRILAENVTAPRAGVQWLDLESTADVQLTSEDPAHPIEAAFRRDPQHGWEAAQPGPQSIWLSFRAPQQIREVHLCFEVDEQRTQEFVLLWSADGGVSYRDIVRQRYNFSSSTRREEETYFPNVSGVTDLKLVIVPDISGGDARASLRAFFVA